MKKLWAWIVVASLSLLAACGHHGRGHPGDPRTTDGGNQAVVRLVPVGPAPGFVPQVSREPLSITRSAPAVWTLPESAKGATLAIRITHYFELTREPTAAAFLDAFKQLPGASQFQCPLVKRDDRLPPCSCANVDGSLSATCNFGPGKPAVFKYEICIKRPTDAAATCLDPTSMIN